MAERRSVDGWPGATEEIQSARELFIDKKIFFFIVSRICVILVVLEIAGFIQDRVHTAIVIW